MNIDEFQSYREYFIDDYGNEIAKNYGYPVEYALNLAEKDLEKNFPQGALTPDKNLMCIDLTEDEKTKTLGYLWYSNQNNNDFVFIYDFYIFKKYRSKGYGKTTLSVLEQLLSKSGIEQIRLRVAYDNQRALKLYKELGFEITGINMAKKIII